MKRVLSLVILSAMLLGMLALAGCSEGDTPKKIYRNEVNAISAADSISFEFDFAFGETGYYMTVESGEGGSAKAVTFTADNSVVKITAEGGKHYYEIDDMRYSVKSEEDSVVMQDILSFSFFHGEASLLEDDLFDGVEFTEVNENEKYIELTLSGEDFKRSIAPDEDVYFSQTTLKATFDGANSLKKVEFATVADGDEFYGIPVGDDKAMTGVFKITKVGGVEVASVDKSKEWTEMPVVALVTPAMLAYRDSMKMDIDASIDIEMMGMTFSVPMDISMSSQLVDGKTITRTLTEINATIMGQSISEKNDVFTDGKGDFEYHTSKDGNYKVAIEEGDGDGGNELLDILNKPETFNNAEIRKTGENTVITITLTSDVLDGLMGSDMMEGDMGGIGDMINGGETSFGESKLIIVISSDGYISSVEMEIEVKQTVGDSDLNVEYEMSVKIKMDASFSDPTDDIVVEIPEGYLDYPLKDEAEAV